MVQAYKRWCSKAAPLTSRDAIAISLSLSKCYFRGNLMNHFTKTSTVAAKLVLLLFLACMASIYLINGTLSSSSAQSTERELDDRVPKHLPIKVKIKKEKEKAFKDLKNEKWVRDFELEITNTGNKPIYFLSLLIDLPGITAPDGTGIAFSVHYGRGQLGSLETKAEPDDIPIKPGETYVFSFPENKQLSWKHFRQRENQPDAKKLILYFQILNFGDGTGFMGSTGIAMPQPADAKLGFGRCKPEPNLNGSVRVKSQHAPRRTWPTIFLTNDLPASFLLALFLPPESLLPASLNLKPQSQLCCSGNDCFRSKPTVNNCLCGGDKPALMGAACSDPSAGCWSPNMTRWKTAVIKMG